MTIANADMTARPAGMSCAYRMASSNSAHSADLHATLVSFRLFGRGSTGPKGGGASAHRGAGTGGLGEAAAAASGVTCFCGYREAERGSRNLRASCSAGLSHRTAGQGLAGAWLLTECVLGVWRPDEHAHRADSKSLSSVVSGISLVSSMRWCCTSFSFAMDLQTTCFTKRIVSRLQYRGIAVLAQDLSVQVAYQSTGGSLTPTPEGLDLNHNCN